MVSFYGYEVAGGQAILGENVFFFFNFSQQ